MRYALVPVKDLTQAKARLASLLSPEERYQLAVAMLDDVVDALRQASMPDRIVFVTIDATALALAARWGFEVIDEGFGRGETGAVELAVKVCQERGASSLAVIPGDIPLLTTHDVDSLMRQGEHYEVVLVPSWDSRGTNAVLMRPPDTLQLRFGSWSFFPHVKQAKRKGLSYKVVRMPRVALDVDTPVDLTRLLPQAVGTRSYAVLARMGMLTRLHGLSLPSPLKLTGEGISPFPPAWGKVGMGGNEPLASPPPAPSPSKGEGISSGGASAKYLPLSALSKGEDSGGGENGVTDHGS